MTEKTSREKVADAASILRDALEGAPSGIIDPRDAEIAALKEASDVRENTVIGYIYLNPDTGTEFSENHPIQSGECDDAENIREATAEALRDELLDAWRSREDAEGELARLTKERSDTRARLDEVRAEIARLREALKESNERVVHYQKIAGKQGTMLFRKDVLLKTARQFGVLSRAYDGSVAVAIADAIDAGTPLAWPSSPFAQRWLNEHSYSDCRGLVGMRITMKLADGVEAGDDGTALSSNAKAGSALNAPTDPRDAEIARLRGALKVAEQFISNGVEFGYIRLPTTPDPALNTLPMIRAALSSIPTASDTDEVKG